MRRRTFFRIAGGTAAGLFAVGGNVRAIRPDARARDAWGRLDREARRRGYELDAVVRPWPWPGSAQRVDVEGRRVLMATVDARRSSADQVAALEWIADHVGDVATAAEPFLAVPAG